MRSSNRVYLPAVDHLRAGAAVLVVLYHGAQLLRSPQAGAPAFDTAQDWSYTTNPLETLVAEGHSGVALFMVLSGFILTTGSLGKDVAYGPFLRNRLLRVGPLYLLLLLVAVGVAGTNVTFLGLVQTVLGFGTLPGGFGTGPFSFVLWTVGVELQFYVLFPLFLRLLATRGPRPLVLFVACAAVMRLLAALTAPEGLDLHQLTYATLVGRIDQFLIGMLAAYVFTRHRSSLGRPGLVVASAAFVLGALWAFNQAHGYAEPGVWRTVWVDVEALVWAALVVTYVSVERVGKGRVSDGLVWVGERSYGVYLVHMPLIFLVGLQGWQLTLTDRPVVDATLTAVALVVPASIALASLTYSAVEQPFLSLRTRYVATPRPVTAARSTVVAVRPGSSVDSTEVIHGLRAGPGRHAEVPTVASLLAATRAPSLTDHRRLPPVPHRGRQAEGAAERPGALHRQA